MDETWLFVLTKEDHRAPEFNSRCGKHVAFDPEHRLVLSVVNGKRSQRHVRRRLYDVERVMCAAVEHDRRVPCLQNRASFRLREQARRAAPSFPGLCTSSPPELRYATVPKTRRNGTVVKVETRR